MKHINKHKRMRVVLLISAFILAVSAPLSAKEPHNVKHDGVIQAKAGSEFVISMESNMTTGYRWELASPVDREHLIVLGLRYIRPKSRAIGAGGTEEWTFKALKPGNAMITFNYQRPWEKKAPDRIKTFIVIIK